MFKEKYNAVYASEIADYLKKQLTGDNIEIHSFKDINNIEDNSVVCVLKQIHNIETLKWIDDNYNNILIITDIENKFSLIKNSYIFTQFAFQDFLKIIKFFFAEKEEIYSILSTETINKNAILDKNIFIGYNVIIGEDVIVGSETKIMHNTVIMGKVKIGNNCLIKSNTLIGSLGFVYNFENKNEFEVMPQLGGIEIKNNVLIGSNNSIEIGFIGNTLLEENVKIDDLVQIGSNAIIKRNTIIAAGSVICRNVIIGENCWIAPKVCIKENVLIGDNCIIGMGSVVINNIPDNSVVVGVPGKIIKSNKNIKD
ncbi:MAG TPA: hypothetical protein PLD27_12525 [bacterium]|nr:hypothetical protein [bacterium]HPQ19998.1 hypothetical protein [bacterium]